MKTKPALHRIQDLSAQMQLHYSREELKGDVSAYLELRGLQLDAQEDDETELASSIGKSMRQIRQKYDYDAWLKEFNRQDNANEY